MFHHGALTVERRTGVLNYPFPTQTIEVYIPAAGPPMRQSLSNNFNGLHSHECHVVAFGVPRPGRGAEPITGTEPWNSSKPRKGFRGFESHSLRQAYDHAGQAQC